MALDTGNKMNLELRNKIILELPNKNLGFRNKLPNKETLVVRNNITLEIRKKNALYFRSKMPLNVCSRYIDLEPEWYWCKTEQLQTQIPNISHRSTCSFWTFRRIPLKETSTFLFTMLSLFSADGPRFLFPFYIFCSSSFLNFTAIKVITRYLTILFVL